MGYLRRVLGVTLRDKGHRSEICKASMSSHFPESLDPNYVNSAMCPKCPRKEWRTKSFRLQSTVHPRESDPKFVQGPGDVTHLRACLAPSWCWASRTIWYFCWSRGIFGSS